MRKAMLLSGLLHAAIIAVAVSGLPRNWQRIEILDQPIPVEIVDIGALTNVPKANRPPDRIRQEAKRDEPKPEPEKTPPERKPREPRIAAPTQPPKEEKAAKKPEPEPKPEPVPEKKPVAEVEKPKPVPEKKPEPEKKPVVEAKKPIPEPKPKPKQEPRQVARVKARPHRKPKPPSDFTSVLKTVEKIRRKRRTREPLEQRADRSTRSDRGRNIPDQPLTISELDTIRRQFISCWNVDVGARNIDKMMVSIRVDLNADRTVRTARVLDRKPSADPTYRAFVESALRAVRNPRCSPVRLPPKKFQMLREFTLRFSAKEMLGL